MADNRVDAASCGGYLAAMQLDHIAMVDAHVRLEPLTPDHREPLRGPAMADPDTWRWWPRDVPGAGWDATVDWQLAEQAAGRWLLYTVFAPDGRAVGQSCYLALRPEHASVEIGGTWYGPDARGGAINPASKRLLFGHAFACGAERVEQKTDALNARSRAAMEKMGATFEGVHRRHMRRPDGSWRDTAWYSVIRPEWPAVKARLDARLG
ncbi:MAG: GNAT family protein [Hyphomonadaceae bacterium]|nr:GNAT family protein [Hyphomonadaceae bacterium]